MSVFLQLALSLLLQSPAPDMDAYHQVPLARVATTSWTHVCTTGRVTYVRRQLDKDWHIRLTDRANPATHIVLEIVPQHPLSRPRLQEVITACGITRYDKQHKWYEIHPLWEWSPDATVLEQMRQSRN